MRKSKSDSEVKEIEKSTPNLEIINRVPASKIVIQNNTITTEERKERITEKRYEKEVKATPNYIRLNLKRKYKEPTRKFQKKFYKSFKSDHVKSEFTSFSYNPVQLFIDYHKNDIHTYCI